MIAAPGPCRIRGPMTKASRPTILIPTTHLGGGHLNLAQALKDMLGSDSDVVIVNPQPDIVGRSYTALSRHFTKLLDWEFISTDNEIASWAKHKVLTLFSRRRLLSIIGQIQPQLIITTHAMLSYALARANERSRKPVPLVFQLTDLGRLHRTWFTEKH